MDIQLPQNKSHRVWLNQHFFPQIQQGDDVINFMNGCYDNNYEIKEYIQDFNCKLNIVEGSKGCNSFYDGIIGQLLDHKFLAYFQLIQSRLYNQFNYKEYQTLFCFCYDWRQSLFNKNILQNLQNNIEQISIKNKVIIITHSAGGILIQNLLLKHPQIQNYIDTLITINCPYDGAGGNATNSILFGYNLLMKFPSQSTKFLTSKIMTWKGLVTQNWTDNKNNQLNKYQIPAGVIVALHTTNKLQDNSFGIEYQKQYQHLSQKYKYYMPHINKVQYPYGGELLLYIFCKENIKRQEQNNFVLSNFCGVLKKLSNYCRKQFLGLQFCIDFNVFKPYQKSCQYLFDFNYEKINIKNAKYKIFTPYSIQLNFNKQIELDSNYQKYVQQGFKNIFTTCETEKIIQVAYQRNINQLYKQNINNYCTEVYDLENLASQQIQNNSFEQIFYGNDQTTNQIYNSNRRQIMSQLNNFQNQQFKCYNILSSGKRTPQFSIAEGIEYKNQIQIQNKSPQFIYVDGDGLVPLLSGVLCPFKNQVYIIPNVSHFMIMQDKRMIDILCNIIMERNQDQ